MRVNRGQMAPFHVKFQMEDSCSLRDPRGGVVDNAVMRTAQVQLELGAACSKSNLGQSTFSPGIHKDSVGNASS